MFSGSSFRLTEHVIEALRDAYLHVSLSDIGRAIGHTLGYDEVPDLECV